MGSGHSRTAFRNMIIEIGGLKRCLYLKGCNLGIQDWLPAYYLWWYLHTGMYGLLLYVLVVIINVLACRLNIIITRGLVNSAIMYNKMYISDITHKSKFYHAVRNQIHFTW